MTRTPPKLTVHHQGLGAARAPQGQPETAHSYRTGCYCGSAQRTDAAKNKPGRHSSPKAQEGSGMQLSHAPIIKINTSQFLVHAPSAQAKKPSLLCMLKEQHCAH